MNYKVGEEDLFVGQSSVVFTESVLTETSTSDTGIIPFMRVLTDTNHKILMDKSGQKIYGLEIDYGIDESSNKTGHEDISSY